MNETPATVRMIDGATAPVISNVFVNNACAVCTLQITGSFAAATVLVEGIVNVASNQWVTLAAFNLSDLSLEKNGADKAGIYQVGIEGILRVRMNVTEVSGGDITIAAQFGNATINQFSKTEASNLIPITAYDLAVAGGYTGTLEQFETDMGNSASNATAAANSADEAAQTLTDVQTAGTEAVDAVQAKGQEVLDSIPEDYTELTGEVGELKESLDLIVQDVNSTTLWENGSFSASTGSSSPNSARLRTITYIDSAVLQIKVPAGYKLIIYGWDGSTYLGVWSGTEFSTSVTKKWSAGNVSAIDINQYNLRLCLERTDSANISVDESAGVGLYKTVDKTLTVNSMPADAKSVGNRLTSLRTDLENQLSDKADKSVQDLFTEQNVSVNLLDTSNAVTGAIMEDGSISIIGAYASYETAYVKLPTGTYTEYAFTTAAGTTISTYRRMYLIKKVSDGTTTYVNQNSVQSTQFTLDEESEVWYSRGVYNQYPTIDRAMIVEGTTITPAYVPYMTETFLDPSVIVGSGNVLFGKKWCPCGDSFTAYTDEFFTDGRYFGKYKTYPYLISERNGINLVETFFASGRTLAMPASPGTFTNSLCNPSADFYYQNIPVDADIITIYLGINDAHHAPGSSGGDGEDNTGEIPIGTVDDSTTATYGGAWNVVLSWLMENRPNAHIGIIVSNGMNNISYRELTLAIAKKYGLAYIDLNGDHITSAMSRPQNNDIADSVKTILRNKWSVDPESNTHPNAAAHLFESYMIEDFIRRI